MSKKTHLVVLCNFTPTPYNSYRIGVPSIGSYELLLNSDDSQYGGTGNYEKERYKTEYIPSHGRDQSINIEVPPMGSLILKFNLWIFESKK